ncbi:hypothetical protein GNX18_14300 [Microbulbifer sp. SH-1]|uniref:hypothetical protein n=1 Tax=Microbulbifer sp. SH-1 TaxID=2681547 RepID=UPI00140CE653|nr:hypothetical protein [Microbulbifer sp. SH-1]QIL90812.1 hypothetical protein GNX18_14300 [Microbulbifer sp. SH-1]
MKSLTVQILVDGQWQDAAELTLSQPERGAASPTTLGYNLDYALRWMERDKSSPANTVINKVFKPFGLRAGLVPIHIHVVQKLLTQQVKQ